MDGDATEPGMSPMSKLEHQPPPRALSVKSFCRRYEIGRTKFYEMLKQGEIRVVKAGRRTLILADDLERWERSLPETTLA